MRIAYFSFDEVNRLFVRRWARRQGIRLACPSVAIAQPSSTGMIVDFDFLPEPFRGIWLSQALAGTIDGPLLVHGHGLTDAVDVFDAPAICEKVWKRLLSGLILDAIEERVTPGDVDVQAALAAFAGDWQAVTAAGAGEEYRADAGGGRWHGSVLAKDSRVIHGSLVLAS
ncbi:MAG TPA: DUF6569 family protein [Gemmataceae bacterium]|jgi:hypothetical protein|nr:DUF6569 family protein [Gemmataceae bacterium]